MPPVELTLPALPPTVKLVSSGKGKKAKLVYVPTAGAKQQIKILSTVASSQALGDQTDTVNIPTLVVVADVKTKTVGADGTAEFAGVVTSADALDVPNSTVPVADFKRDLITTVPGMTITGSVAANGAAGELKLRIEKPDKSSVGAMQLVKLALPTWPVLPSEAVGVGAKWTVTVKTLLQDKVEVSLVTTYELVSRGTGTWVVKGATKVSGAEQTLEGAATVGKIGGSGTSEATVTAGTVFPVMTAATEIGFTATSGGDALVVKLLTKGVVEAGATPAVPTP